MELKYIEQFSSLPNTILTEPISNKIKNAIKNGDINITHIDVGEVGEKRKADFSKYDYKISCVHIAVYAGITDISIRLEKYAQKEEKSMSKEARKNEAIKRMKILELHPNCINEFVEEDRLNLSDDIGVLYWLDDEQKKIVEDFETEHDVTVYHAIHDFNQIGEFLSLLYVGNSAEERDYQDNDLATYGYVFACVKNLTRDDCYEFVTIAVKPMNGGLVRID